MSNDEYIYEIIKNEDDARYCAQLIAEEFSAHNPITYFDRITSTCFFNECSWPLLKNVLDEHISLLVRDRSTNKIIATTFAGDLYLQHEKKNLSDTSHTIAVDHLLDEMDELFIKQDFGQELKPNMVLHVTLCAVHSQYAGKGIITQMCKRICDYASKEKGFQYILVQVTSQATRHIWVNKLGGKEVTIIDPTTWIWKRKGDEVLYPYKDYEGGLIPNILVKL
ncbi:unnamed protein product [Adineta steineri]|uniref:N-acetyltransferase domain-containing protein n=1 Tax=Adineta steineri TaxID=433720 RepID=A0A818UJ22_9BILA|nr:unnamed protein product [Adineta steineri]CAF3699137.1 unnamed protein product [Adineta steineri]